MRYLRIFDAFGHFIQKIVMVGDAHKAYPFYAF
jgi:hypothetical protein